MRFCRSGFYHEGLEEKLEVHEGKIKELKKRNGLSAEVVLFVG